MHIYSVIPHRARCSMFALCWLTSSLAFVSGLPGENAGSLQFLQPKPSEIVSTARPTIAQSSISGDDDAAAWTKTDVITHKDDNHERAKTAADAARLSPRSLRSTPSLESPSVNQFYYAAGSASARNNSHSSGVTMKNFKDTDPYKRDGGLSWDVGPADPIPEVVLSTSLGDVYSFEFVLNHRTPDVSILQYADLVHFRLKDNQTWLSVPLKTGESQVIRCDKPINLGWHHYVVVSHRIQWEIYVDGKKCAVEVKEPTESCVRRTCTHRGLIGPVTKKNVVLRQFESFDSALSDTTVRTRFDAVGWIQEMAQSLVVPTEIRRDNMDDGAKERLKDMFFTNIRATLRHKANLTEEQNATFRITVCDLIFLEDNGPKVTIGVKYVVAIQQHAQRQLRRAMESQDTWSKASFLSTLAADVLDSVRGDQDRRRATREDHLAAPSIVFHAPELTERYFLPRKAETPAPAEASTTPTARSTTKSNEFQAPATSVSSIVWILVGLILCSSAIFIGVAYLSQHRKANLRPPPPPPNVECSSVFSSECSYSTSSSFVDSLESHSQSRSSASFSSISSFSDVSEAISATKCHDGFDEHVEAKVVVADIPEPSAPELLAMSNTSIQATDGTGFMSVASF